MYLKIEKLDFENLKTWTTLGANSLEKSSQGECLFWLFVCCIFFFCNFRWTSTSSFLLQFASTKMISRLQCLKQVSRVVLASRASASTSSGSSSPGASTTAISKSDEFQDIETHTGQVSCCYYWWWSLWMITNTLVHLIGVWKERLPSGSICRQDEEGLCCQHLPAWHLFSASKLSSTYFTS